MQRRYLCGLGNPGPQYARTRHNVGFWVLDRLAAQAKLPEPRLKHEALYSRAVVDGVQWTLLWPQTFMNDSGRALAEWKRREGLDPASELLVIYDDMDLEPGRLRLRPEGGPGSHNGMASLVEQMATRSFARLRIGIGRPLDPAEWADYVLKSFPPDDKALVEKAVERAALACADWTSAPSFETLMNKVNAK